MLCVNPLGLTRSSLKHNPFPGPPKALPEGRRQICRHPDRDVSSFRVEFVTNALHPETLESTQSLTMSKNDLPLPLPPCTAFGERSPIESWKIWKWWINSRSRIASTVACKYLQVVWHGLTRTKPFLVPLDSYPNLCAAECPQQMGGEQSFHPQLAACMQNQTWAILLISFCYFSGWSAVRGSSLDRFQLDRLVLCLGSGVPSAYSVGLPVKHDTHCMTLHQSVVKLLSQTEPFFKLLFFSSSFLAQQISISWERAIVPTSHRTPSLTQLQVGQELPRSSGK